MLRKILFVLACIPALVKADVKWDIPPSKMGDVTGDFYVKDLTVGDKAKLDDVAIFCRTNEDTLAVSGYTVLGEGETAGKMLPGGKLELTVADPRQFLNDLFEYEYFVRCDWWGADFSEHSVVIDSINGMSKLSDFLEPAKAKQ